MTSDTITTPPHSKRLSCGVQQRIANLRRLRNPQPAPITAQKGRKQMSEIYRMERAGTAPPLPEDGKCDCGKTPGVDDCRGEICDDCAATTQSKSGEWHILATMVANGGAFARQLALTAQVADPHNYERLRAAFPELWTRYAEMHESIQRKDETK